MVDISKYKHWILAVAAVLVVGVSIGGTSCVCSRRDAQRHAVETAQARAQVAEALKQSALHDQRANDLAEQRDLAKEDAKIANQRAAVSLKKMQEALDQPKPEDLSEQLEQAESQLAATHEALLDEQEAHKKDNAEKVILAAENDELRLANADLKTGLTGQIKLTTKLQMDLETSEKGRIRWRNVSIGVSLLGAGTGLGSWLSHR